MRFNPVNDFELIIKKSDGETSFYLDGKLLGTGGIENYENSLSAHEPGLERVKLNLAITYPMKLTKEQALDKAFDNVMHRMVGTASCHTEPGPSPDEVNEYSDLPSLDDLQDINELEVTL